MQRGPARALSLVQHLRLESAARGVDPNRELLQLMASRGGKVGVALTEAAISGRLRLFFLDLQEDDERDEERGIQEVVADQLVEAVHVDLQGALLPP